MGPSTENKAPEEPKAGEDPRMKSTCWKKDWQTLNKKQVEAFQEQRDSYFDEELPTMMKDLSRFTMEKHIGENTRSGCPGKEAQYALRHWTLSWRSSKQTVRCGTNVSTQGGMEYHYRSSQSCLRTGW
jgi:hypothetical protein